MDVLSATTAQGRIGHCRIKEEGTLLDCLATFGLTREESEHLLFLGAIYHERERACSDLPVSSGQYVRVHLQPKRFRVEDVDWSAVVHEGNDEFIVVNKPPGIPVHATVDNRIENVLHQLSVALQCRLFISQRLDAEVGGLMVIAKTPEFHRQFNQLLARRQVKKRYRALVNNAPEVGRHIHYMKPAARSPKTVRSETKPGWLECVLNVDRVTPVESAVGEPRVFEVEIDLATGRTHQIRAQLSEMGSPILGDKLYGSPTPHEVSGTLCPGIALFSASTSWSGEGGRTWFFSIDRSSPALRG